MFISYRLVLVRSLCFEKTFRLLGKKFNLTRVLFCIQPLEGPQLDWKFARGTCKSHSTKRDVRSTLDAATFL